MWPYDLVFLAAGLFLLLMIWYLRERGTVPSMTRQSRKSSAANNIGTIWRDEQKPKRALSWFQRAVKLGDDGSNLEIAMHYLRDERDPRKAASYLDKVCRSARVSEGEMEKAKRLLKEAQRRLGNVTPVLRVPVQTKPHA